MSLPAAPPPEWIDRSDDEALELRRRKQAATLKKFAEQGQQAFWIIRSGEATPISYEEVSDADIPQPLAATQHDQEQQLRQTIASELRWARDLQEDPSVRATFGVAAHMVELGPRTGRVSS